MKQAKDMSPDGRPSVLGVRFGVNPNSSSLGVDVTYLMFGGTLAFATSLVLGAWLRRWRPKAEEFGRPEDTASEQGGAQEAAGS